MSDNLLASHPGAKNHQWERFCLFLVVTLCIGTSNTCCIINAGFRFDPNILKGLALQPVVWVLLGVIALVKISVGMAIIVEGARTSI